MSAIDVKEIGGVIEDAEMRFTQQGKPVTKVRLGFSDAVLDQQTQQWSNVNQFYVEGTAWERTAEQIAEVATKGTQLLVWGKLVTDSWEDRETGQKRSKPALKIKGFRPVSKLPDVGNNGGSNGGGFGGQQPAGDPWAQPQGNAQPGGWGTPQGNAPAGNWGGQQQQQGGSGGAPSGRGSRDTSQGEDSPF